MIPAEPACWFWTLPAGPVVNHRGTLLRWQDGRCAACGATPPELVEDHDHATGDTRGYLCERCNTREALSADPVWALYRRRPATAVLGLMLTYGRVEHHDVRTARIELGRAGTGKQERKQAEREQFLARLAERYPEMAAEMAARDAAQRAESEATIARVAAMALARDKTAAR